MRRELKYFKSGKNKAEKLEMKQKSNDVKGATESENNNEKKRKGCIESTRRKPVRKKTR